VRTALVTGAAGFVGSHITRALLDDGWAVKAIDLVEALGVEQQDALDVFRNDTFDVDLAVHCAAIVGGRSVIDGTPLSIATNLALDSWFVRWGTVHAGRMVYFSSSAAYPVALQDGVGPPILLRETDLFAAEMADNTYGLAKVIGEHLVQLANRDTPKCHIFRPFSGYGEDQDLAYPFPSFIARALRRDDPFEIWGDGRQTRDFIHIDDVVEAVLKAINTDFWGPVNLGTGIGTTFDQLAAMVCAAVGYTPKIRHLVDKPTGVQHRVADVTIMSELHVPDVTLDEGISRSLQWQREEMELQAELAAGGVRFETSAEAIAWLTENISDI
jgi:nucleoside-diphosphate-sugar epimerase